MPWHGITKNEFILALSFAVAGFIMSSREVILYFDSLNPIMGLALYYVIITVAVLIFSHYGLTVSGIKIKWSAQIFGTLLIAFVFFLVFNMENPLAQYYTGRVMEGASQIFYQSEDGAIFYLWQSLGNLTVETIRILAFVITPFVLTLVGAKFVEGKVKIPGFCG